MDKETQIFLNRPRQLCFIKECEPKSVIMNGVQCNYIEVVLEIHHKGKGYFKLAYIGKEAYDKAIRNIKPGLNVEVVGKRAVSLPFEPSATEFDASLGIFKINDIIFFQSRFTGNLETKEEFLYIKQREKEKREKRQNAKNQR